MYLAEHALHLSVENQLENKKKVTPSKQQIMNMWKKSR